MNDEIEKMEEHACEKVYEWGPSLYLSYGS